MAELLIYPAIFWGIIVGIYELASIHADESFVGFKWMGHGLQAAMFSFIFVFLTMNTAFALEKIPILESIPYATAYSFLPVRILIGVIAMVKIQAASVVTSLGRGRFATRGIGEHLIHTLIAGLLIIFAPEIMTYLWPLISGIFPFGK